VEIIQQREIVVLFVIAPGDDDHSPDERQDRAEGGPDDQALHHGRRSAGVAAGDRSGGPRRSGTRDRRTISIHGSISRIGCNIGRSSEQA